MFQVQDGQLWHFINCDYKEYISEFEDWIQITISAIEKEKEFTQELYDQLWFYVEGHLTKRVFFIVDADSLLSQLHEEDIIKDVIWEIENYFRQMKRKLINNYDRQH